MNITKNTVFLSTVLLMPLMALADTWTDAKGITWTYSISDGSAEVCGSWGNPAISSSTKGSVTIPSTLGGCPVTSIGAWAFYGCSGLTSVTIPSSVTSIGYRAFVGCSGLTSMTIPEGVASIGESAFVDCSGLTTVTIPSSVTSIGESAFELSFPQSSKLTSVYISDLAAWCGIKFGDSDANPIRLTSQVYVNSEEVKNLVVPDGVASIGEYAFRGCGGLTSVTIPSGVTSIGGFAFAGCRGLTSVTISEGVTSIGDRAFQYCSGLTSVAIPSSVTNIGELVFFNCSGLTSATMLEGVTSIGDYAFYNCSGLTSVTIPSSVTSIGLWAFENCNSLTSVYISDLAAWCGIKFATQDANPAFYAKHIYVNGEEVNDLVVPDGVTSIGNCAFNYYSGLTSVTIPSSVTNIGQYAFFGCRGLTSVTISEGVMSIGDYAFCNCSGLTSVTIPSSVTSVGERAFEECSGLTSVAIPSSVTSIGDHAFYGCSGLTSVTIPSGVKYIGDWAFYGCSGLMSVRILEGVERVGVESFAYCSGLRSVTIPSSVTEIWGGAFSECWLLEEVHVGNDGDIDAVKQMLSESGFDVGGVTFDYVKLDSASYKVAFDAAGGTAEWTKGEVVRNEAVGTLPTATREGYEFLGWFTAAVGGTQVTAATVVTEDVTYYAQWKVNGGETPPQNEYGLWETDDVKNPDKLGPTMLTDMTLTLNGSAGAVGDVVAAYRMDLETPCAGLGLLCGLGKVMDESGTLTMACYAPTGVKLHFKVWVAASGVEEPVVVDCDAKSDLTAPTSGAFLSGHALVVSDDKDLTISLGSADWHTVSFNVLPDDPSPAAVFGSVKAKIAAVTQGIEFWMPGKSSSLKAIEIGKGYWVNTKVEDVEWTVSGKTDPKVEIALEEGWNLIGYAPETEGAVQQVLKTALAAKAVDYVTYGVEFYPGGTLKKMEPGKAYWVHAKKAYTLVYDEQVESSKFKVQSAVKVNGDRNVAAPLLDAAVPTYGPWGESEAVKNPDKLGPTFLTDLAVEIDGEPAAYGDVVAVFRGDTVALCGLGKVMDDSGTLTVVCYAPKGVALSFKVWVAESGVEEPVVVKCDNASKLIAPESGDFYDGHAISGSTAELIETIVPGEKVTIDTGLIGYTASGLPTGLKYDKTSGKITGSASKPTAAEGAVVKFTKKGFETEELTIVVTAIPKVAVAMEGVNSPGATDGCKVTGAGAYLVGKKVTLKTTVPKGTVFVGWFDGEDAVATQATYVFTMGKENIALVAKFKKEVMSVGCETLSSKESFPAGVLGAEGGIALDISTESGVKSVKVDKLPAGMKYDAKSERITGAPTKAGDNTVVITVTAVSGAVAKKEIEVKVAAMPVMAVGTFTGFVSVGADNFGTFTLTTTDAGKLTAKVVTAAGTVSFSGTCWDAVEDGVYRAALTTKKGETLTLTLDSTAGWNENQLSGAFATAAIAETKKTAAVPSRTYSVSAQRNAFGKTWYFAATGDETAGWKFAYTEDTKGAALTVTLKADGSTSIAGALPNGTDAKGKAVTIKVSASGYANVGGLKDGAILADFAPVLTVNKVKTVLAIKTNLWFDRSNDHAEGAGEARFVK